METTLVEVKKLKVKNDTFVEIEFKETCTTKDDVIEYEVKKICKKPIHDDFKNAMFLLRIHMIFLTDYLNEHDFYDSDLVEDDANSVYFHEKTNKFRVSGFTIGGDDENKGVCLIGERVLRGNRRLNIVTPFERFEDSDYAFSYELEKCVTKVLKETELYLNGKFAPQAQMEVFNEE